MKSELRPSEPHPSSLDARDWIASLSAPKLILAQEAFSSCAIEGNRMGEICSETLRRLMAGEPVSDRYVLGLAWALREIGVDK